MKPKFSSCSHEDLDEEEDLFAPDLIDESDELDVVTVEDLIYCLKQYAKRNDKVIFRCKKQNLTMFLDGVKSKGGNAVLDLKTVDHEEDGFEKLKENETLLQQPTVDQAAKNPAYNSLVIRSRMQRFFPEFRDDPETTGWILLPLNFPVSFEQKYKDFLCPEKSWPRGTLALCNMSVPCGEYEGRRVYIPVQSYVDAYEENDEDALMTLKKLRFPISEKIVDFLKNQLSAKTRIFG